MPECLLCKKFSQCILFSKSFMDAKRLYIDDGLARHRYILNAVKDCEEFVEME